jgi:hypothetical protein
MLSVGKATWLFSGKIGISAGMLSLSTLTTALSSRGVSSEVIFKFSNAINVI